MTTSRSEKMEYDYIVDTINAVLDEGIDDDVSTIMQEFAETLGASLAERFKPDENKEKRGLRLSQIGHKCLRKLWYDVNKPEAAIPIKPSTKLIFTYGEIIEHLVLFLAKRGGLDVKDEQREVEVHGVKGHIDAIVDGLLIDVKSAGSKHFVKFMFGLQERQDLFGYLEQVKSYCIALGRNDAAFLVVDKLQGRMLIDYHRFSDEELEEQSNRIKHVVEVTSNKDVLPDRAFHGTPKGKSGNLELSTVCRYCAYKLECWPDIRAFKYSNGITFFTHIEKEPNVEEVTHRFK